MTIEEMTDLIGDMERMAERSGSELLDSSILLSGLLIRCSAEICRRLEGIDRSIQRLAQSIQQQGDNHGEVWR